MKYKIVLNFFYCIFIFTLLNLSVYGNTFSPSQDKQISEMLNHFYKSYINEISKDTHNFLTINSIKNRYLTLVLQDKIALSEIGYDSIIDAQDSSLEWLDTLKIEKNKQKDDEFLISYTDTYSKKL